MNIRQTLSLLGLCASVYAATPCVQAQAYAEADSMEYLSPEISAQLAIAANAGMRVGGSFRVPEVFDIKMATPRSRTVIDTALATAKRFMGTRHRIGGLDTSGIDCSGLVMTAFNAAKLDLPRVSYEIAEYGGRAVEKTNLRRGDIMCFSPDTAATVSHVGIVWETRGTEVLFIHTSTSRGVTISSINLANTVNLAFWEKRFRYAVRPIE